MCELTILMPCLNEAETLQVCIRNARRFLSENQVEGEVLIADNGSTDGSIEIAEREGARVVHIEQKGYGSALIGGTKAALGKYVIMGDSDDSYDFLHLMPFLEKLREGYELVMGNRFAGGIERDAMPWSHRYIGNPVLSFIGRLFYRSKIRDFHCGLRGYNKESILALHLHTSGMEYASEMVVKSELSGLRITEVPTTLKKDGRNRPPHLRSFRDGWRHLKFLFIYAPSWLYLYPGIALIVIGLLGSGVLVAGQFRVGDVVFGIHTLLYCMFFLIMGINILLLFEFTRIYACTSGFLPVSERTKRILQFREDRLIFGGGFLVLAGLIVSIAALMTWSGTGYADLVPEQVMRITIPGAAMLEIGVQFIFSGFFMGTLKVPRQDGTS